MECPKCHYVRQPGDTAPEWQCPSCGIAYHKFSAKMSTPVTPDDDPPDHRFRNIRILFLLIILLLVAGEAWLTKSKVSSWQEPLQIVIYPINGDGSRESSEYIAVLQEGDFEDVEQFMISEVERYSLNIDDPLDIYLGPIVTELPPAMPSEQSIFNNIVWSLKLRYWARENDHVEGVEPDIRLFVLFHKLEKKKSLKHSTGLQKGMIGIVHAFADSKMNPRNNVVIAHEMLHTLGASDKYNLSTGLPIHPHGYADPRQSPLYPQQYAEIMGGKIPQQAGKAKMPDSLSDTLIGEMTATEIGWAKSDLR